MKPKLYEVFQMNTHGCPSPTSRSRKSLFCSSGFTLIELLVVIAIIGLLLSIMLPGLRKAKQAAEALVCKAHLKSIGNGVNQYTTAWDQWIPGPSTSGARAAMVGGYDPLSPYQNVDWMSPMLGDALGLPADPLQRLLDLLNDELRCPSNRVKNDYIYPSAIPGVNPDAISYSSYSAILGFHMYPSEGRGQASTNKGPGMRVVTDWEIYNRVQISRSYEPKLTKVGTPSSKVFVTEGSRYYDETRGVSFNNLPYQDDGGNFMIQGPVFRRNGDPYLLNRTNLTDPSTWALSDVALRLAYRHNKKINLVFFDGHCETADMFGSLRPSYYFPRGTYVTAMGALLMQAPNTGEGTIQ
jgi:prepilin-type N-terminal cleavage/methylation domain-containing protein/prepilin-type processing-associated H-X9-DG protein